MLGKEWAWHRRWGEPLSVVPEFSADVDSSTDSPRLHSCGFVSFVGHSQTHAPERPTHTAYFRYLARIGPSFFNVVFGQALGSVRMAFFSAS